jgi:hypothetical protein
MSAPNLSGSFGNPPLNSTPQTSPSHLPQQLVDRRQLQPPQSSPPNPHERWRGTPDPDDIPLDDTISSSSKRRSSPSPQSASTSVNRRSSRGYKTRASSPPKKRLATATSNSNSRGTVNSIHQYIKRKGWSVTGFLRAWILEDAQTESQKRSRTKRRQAIAQFVLQEDILSLLIDSLQDKSTIGSLVAHFQPYSAEFNQLSKTRPFRKWQVDGQTVPKPDFTAFDIADDMTIVRDVAPQWTALIHKLVQPPRHSWPSLQAQARLLEDDEKNTQLITWMITSMIMHKRAPRSSVFPITSLGLWLHDAGVKDRVIVGLAKLGCCPGIDAINNRLDELGEYAKVSSMES